MNCKAEMDRLRADKILRDVVDFSLDVPRSFDSSTDVHFIVLGQDPTVKNPESRKKITRVLNLDVRHGSVRRYLEQICYGLGINLDQHVMATNLVKNFFKEPPACYDKSILSRAAAFWRPSLLVELGKFPAVPIISLGQPLLQVIVLPPASARVRDYWGYAKGANVGRPDRFGYLRPAENVLGRIVFPMPHQPSIRKRFYANTLTEYVEFIKHTSRTAGYSPIKHI
jgi:hypothetical protein